MSDGNSADGLRDSAFFARGDLDVHLEDLFRGCAAFLLCGGPSLADVEPALFQERGILTCAVNNAATVVRPNLWIAIDDPGNFDDRILRDPAILKFLPHEHATMTIRTRDAEGHLVSTDTRVEQLPSVFHFRRNAVFCPDTWLTERSFNVGSHDDAADPWGNKGVRSVLLPAIKLLYVLGVRRVYLLGCDFHMSYGQKNYAFDQSRSRREIQLNNSIFRVTSLRLEKLRPYFENAGFFVFNCTPKSDLNAFPRKTLDQALGEALSQLPKNTSTAGWYDKRLRMGEQGIQRNDLRTSMNHGHTGNGQNPSS